MNMTTDIATQIKHLADLAEGPRREFQPWKAVVIHRTPQPLGFQLGVPLQLFSYKVPRGKNLIITNVELFVANTDPAPPASPAPTLSAAAVQPHLIFESLFGYWAINDRPVTNRTAHYSVLAGPQLRVFPATQCARAYVLAGVATAPGIVGFSFRLEGFLTLAEYGQRLKHLETEIPNTQQLACP